MDESTYGFAGSWNVLEATLPTGLPAYTGSIHVNRTGYAFDLLWEITAGRYVGIGLPVHGHLVVACGEQRAGLGIALFRVQAGAQVEILWSTPELQGTFGYGEITSPFTGPFEGEHEVRQHLPNEALHGTWTVGMHKTGSLYEITWRKGDAVHFRGIGLEVQGDLVVGWYPDLPQLAVLDYAFDPHDWNRVLATWALGGQTGLGTEVLQRGV